MENKSHALAAGTFVMVLVALLVALAVWLTRDSQAQRMYELSSREAVTGLQPEASVRFKGVNIGKVIAIGFDPQVAGNVLIRIAIDDQAPITKSTFGTLGFQGVTGLAFVQLDDRGESQVLLPETEPPARIPMRPSLLSRLTAQGESILVQLEESSRRVNQLLSPDHQKNLMAAIDNMGQAAASVKLLSDDANKMLPALIKDADVTFKTMQETSVQVGKSADEANRSARAFRTVTERMSAPGGTLDQLSGGVDTLAATGQALNATTLPRVNRALDDTARMTRQVGQAASAVSDNPQSLIFGGGSLPPGPGEAGFSAPASKP